MSEPKYLLDVNVLIALTDSSHVHHQLVNKWFGNGSFNWGVCAFSEAGFLRVSTNPRLRGYSLEQATAILAEFTRSPGYCFWGMTRGWASLSAPFTGRVFGHQQITDAYLLGLAVQENGVLVTLDRAFKYMAGEQWGKNLFVLE
ncbi:MAG: TA system VapC family ribonuclease toxin [Terracidiphilus sp.]